MLSIFTSSSFFLSVLSSFSAFLSLSRSLFYLFLSFSCSIVFIALYTSHLVQALFILCLTQLTHISLPQDPPISLSPRPLFFLYQFSHLSFLYLSPSVYISFFSLSFFVPLFSHSFAQYNVVMAEVLMHWFWWDINVTGGVSLVRVFGVCDDWSLVILLISLWHRGGHHQRHCRWRLCGKWTWYCLMRFSISAGYTSNGIVQSWCSHRTLI